MAASIPIPVKPYAPRLDLSQPILWLQVGWWMAPQAGRRVVNLCGADIPTVGADVVIARDIYGPTFQVGSNTPLDLGSSNRFLASTDPFTFAWLEKIGASPPLYGGIAVFTCSGTSNPFIIIRTGDTGNYLFTACGIRTGSNAIKFANTVSPNNSIGVWTLNIITGTAGMITNGSTVPNASTFTHYFTNYGSPDLSNTFPTIRINGGQGASTFSSSTTAANMFGYDNADSKPTGFIDNGRLWKRVLSYPEILALFADPFIGCRRPSDLDLGLYTSAQPSGTLKTAIGVPRASIKTIGGLAIASVKTYGGLTA